MTSELKYAPNRLYFILGVLWVLIGVMNLIIMGFSLWFQLQWIPFFYSLLALLCSLNGFYYLRLPRITYIAVEPTGLLIARGPVLQKRFVSFNDVQDHRLVGKTLRMMLRNGKEIGVKYDLLSLNDIRILEEAVQSGTGSTKSILD